MPRPPPPSPSSCCGRKSAAAAVSRHVAVATWDPAWRWAPACHRRQRRSHDATQPSAGAPSFHESGTVASGAPAGTMPTRGQGSAAKAAAAAQTLRDLIWCPLVLPPPPDASPYGGGETPRDPAPARRSICSHLSWLVNHLQERRPPTARSLPGGKRRRGWGQPGERAAPGGRGGEAAEAQRSKAGTMPGCSCPAGSHGCLEGCAARTHWQRAAGLGALPALRLARCPQRRGWSSPKAILVYSSSRAPWS